jgi:hypothetical protein
MNKTLKFGMTTGVISLALAPAAFAEDGSVMVTSDHMKNWIDASLSGATATMVDGAPAGLGSSSLELKTTADVNAQAVYAHPDNIKLSDLSSASYWTKQNAASSDGGSASMTLGVDLNGDGTWDTNLVFEPYWQNNASPDAGPVVKGEWQQWDVASGLFWSSRDFGSGDAALSAGHGGAPFYSLANIKANYPDARVMVTGVSVGTYNTDYTIDVDGIELNGTTYNFERSSGNIEPTNKDDCKKDGWKMLKNVDGRMFKNQGQCVSYTNHNEATMDASVNTSDASSEAHARAKLMTR